MSRFTVLRPRGPCVCGVSVGWFLLLLLQQQQQGVLCRGDDDVMEASDECHSGWTLKDGQCVKEVARKPICPCPPKASLENGQCVIERAVKVSLACAAGQQLVGDKCEFEEKAVALSSCPKGFVFNGLSCSKSKEVAGSVACPQGFKASESRDTCLRESKQKAAGVCPDGSALQHGDKCLSVETVAAAKSCPLGFSMVDNSCIHEDTSKAEISCPFGLRLEEGVCKPAQKVAANPVCPPEYAFDGKDCMRVWIAEPTVSCPHGYHLSGDKCLKVIEKETVLLCPHGFEVVERQCVKRKTVKPQAECPEGTVSSWKLGKPLCESIEAHQPALKCAAADAVLEGDRCVRRVSAPLHSSCPFGYKASADGCLRETQVSPEYICSGGAVLHDDHYCVLQETVPSRPYCEDGHPTPQGTCVKLYAADLIYNCPLGFRLDGLSCSRKAQVHAASTCPLNTRMRGDLCVSTETLSPQPHCEASFVPTGDGFCVKIEVKAPKKLCPKTHKLFNTYCVRKVGAAALFRGSQLSPTVSSLA